jgi:hypothetical protein
MSFTQQILEKANALSEGEFNYTTSSDFSLTNSLNDDCNAIVMEATVIYFDIKNIDVLLKTGKRLAARVYKLYYNALKRICQETGGHLNCYSPHSFLMIYPKDDYDMSYVVDVAMKTADLISMTLREPIEKHSHNNFSIGVDNGNILGTRTIDGNESHISWFGNAIEKANAISHLCMRPFFVGLSGTVYHHLDDSMKKTTKRILGIKKEVEVWTRVSYQFENQKKHLYQTNFHRTFEEAGE